MADLDQIMAINNDTELKVSFAMLNKFAEALVGKACNKMQSNIARGVIDPLLTADEVAEKLRVSKRTLSRWNTSKYLQHIEVGGYRRYRTSDVLKIINQNDITPCPSTY